MERTDPPAPQPSPAARQLLAEAAADWEAAQNSRATNEAARRDQLALTIAHAAEGGGRR